MKTYIERQNECGLKVGDKVKVVRTALSKENGWGNAWVTDMDESVNKEFTIRKISEDGIRFVEDDYFAYPYFILEKVSAEENPMVAFLEDLAAILKKHKAGLAYTTSDDGVYVTINDDWKNKKCIGFPSNGECLDLDLLIRNLSSK